MIFKIFNGILKVGDINLQGTFEGLVKYWYTYFGSVK